MTGLTVYRMLGRKKPWSELSQGVKVMYISMSSKITSLLEEEYVKGWNARRARGRSWV